jgi:hypothetical protein
LRAAQNRNQNREAVLRRRKQGNRFRGNLKGKEAGGGEFAVNRPAIYLGKTPKAETAREGGFRPRKG